MSGPLDIREIIDASRAAAERAHVDMDVADKALDTIRASGTESLSLFDLWAAIDEQIGKAEAPGLQQQLIALRVRFIDAIIAAEVARIEEAFKQSPDVGWNAWLITLAEAVTLFRFGFSARLCEHLFPLQESKKQVVENFRKAVRCMYQSRWPEAYDQLDYLTRQDVLPVVTQARLLVMLGQIHLFIFRKSAPAKQLFDAAERLAPNDVRVLSALGDYWLGENDSEKAKLHYERAIEVEPGMPNGYVGMGSYFEKEMQLQAAEEWYQKAIASASGDGLGYEKLLKLYGRQEFFETRGADLHLVMEQAIAVNPEGEHQLYCDLGYLYEQNKQFGKAQKWYEKAVVLDETDPGGYSAIAGCYNNQDRNEDAEAAYKKAIEVAPECYDGYWGLALLYEQQERWEDALEWYKKAPLHSKEWARIIRAKVGEMYSRLQNYTEAEKILKHELRIDKDNDTAKNILQTIADDYYQEHGDTDAATRLYGEILEILGDSYRGDYHNRLGNLHYFYDKNVQAAEEYRRAIAAKPDTAVFHRNLANAHQQLKDYPQAAQEFETAFRIDQDAKAFDKQMALLLNAEGNDYYTQGNYREAVERYTKAIELDHSDDVIYSNLAGAWEQSKEPGRRMEALDNAIEAFRGAQSINATKNYEKHIERLGRKKEFASRYGEKAFDWLHIVTPIMVEVASNLIPYTEGSTQGTLSDELARHLTDMRARVQNHFGVKIPGVRVRGNETDLADGAYIIMIMEIPLVSGSIALDQRFFPGPEEALSSLGVTGEAATNPLTGDRGFWINQDNWQRVETAGLELWDVVEYLIRHLEAVVQRNLIEFLGHQEVAGLLERESYEALEEVCHSQQKLTALTTVWRALVVEGVPIKPFGEISKVFERLYSEGANLQSIVEAIRALPLLRSRLPGNDKQYSLLRLGPRFEAEIRNAIYQTTSHTVLAMEPARCQSALNAVRSGIDDDRHVALIVDDAELRPFVRLLIELEFPNFPVLSRRELRTDFQVERAGLIELEEEVTPAKPDFRSRRQVDMSSGELEDRGKDGTQDSNDIAISVFVNETFTAQRANADDQPIEDMFSLMRDGLFYELGVILPEVRLESDNALKTNEFRFKLNGREFPPVVGLERDEFLVNDTVDRLRLLNITGRDAVNPANGGECAIVRGEEVFSEVCHQAGLTTWGPAGFLVLTLSAEIRKNATTFQTINATQYILDSLRAAFPELIDTALKRFSVEQVCLILRDLLDEEISIRDLRSILESALSINGTTDVDLSRYIVFTPRTQNLCPVAGGRGVDGLATADYSNFVRTSLKRYISHKYTRGSNTLLVYLLDPDIERRIGNVGAQPLTSEEHASLKAAVRHEVGSLPPTAQNPVLLTTMDIRRTVRKLIETDFPNLAVLSYQELSLEMSIQPIARISWS
jgi:type III secretory pathway component EscV/Tfp pilus assembly protein PilF